VSGAVHRSGHAIGSPREDVCRLLKTAHLRRWFASALAATYFQYASLGLRQTALHPDHFEQPERNGFFSSLLAMDTTNLNRHDAG